LVLRIKVVQPGNADLARPLRLRPDGPQDFENLLWTGHLFLFVPQRGERQVVK
jgi:hypothetical protein